MEGKTHALTVRDVKLSEAGKVKLTAKDFQTQATLTVRGNILILLTIPQHSPSHVIYVIYHVTNKV